MLIAAEYLDIISKRGKSRKKLERVYRWIRNPEILEMAYMNLYSNDGAMTRGTDIKDTIDGMSLSRIEKLSETLRDGKFEWKPARRIYVPKKDGKSRSLGNPNWKDKIVQEAIRIVLAAYYEPQFSSLSHGFRTGRGCHTALTQILHGGWTGTKWFIEGDIKGCFDNIRHHRLLEIISENIRDDRFLKLMKGMLSAGYMEDWKYHGTYSGTPQGGIVSPLLANIYLNELDVYVESELIPQYTKGKSRKPNKEYKRLEDAIRRASKQGDTEKINQLRKEKAVIPSGDPNDPEFRRLKYVRYADDFLLGFIGSKNEAQEIKEKLKNFIKDRLDMELSEEKTLITHAATESARFLNYEIIVPIANSRVTSEKSGNKRRALNGKPQLIMPEDVQKSLLNKYSKAGKAIQRPELYGNADYDIIMTYKTELLGIYNYYCMANNVSKLYEVKTFMYWSLVHTLANKYKTSENKILRKYRVKKGKKRLECIEVKVERTGKKPLVATFGEIQLCYNGKYLIKTDNRETKLTPESRVQ